uniref:Uncharacterized protein n=1 Tax=Rhizophora mucronata TaxID=61149 RepID=A0A2P2QUI8_RHIMU
MKSFKLPSIDISLMSTSKPMTIDTGVQNLKRIGQKKEIKLH